GPDDVVTEIVVAGFGGHTNTPVQRELNDVVQTEIAERLMLLAANAEATPEIQAAALQGVLQVQARVNRVPNEASAERLKREIKLFLENPKQNLPQLRPSGAPPGPPV